MGLFSRDTSSDLCRAYIAQSPFPRKDLLSATCAVRISRLPVCSREQIGRPIASTVEMGPAIQTVWDVMGQDGGIHAWVARNAALMFALSLPQGPAWMHSVEEALGTIGLQAGPQLTAEAIQLVDPSQADGVRGLANAALSILWVMSEDGPPADRSYYEHMFSSPAPETVATAVEITAWFGIVMGRVATLGWYDGSPLLDSLRNLEAGFIGMSEPGWYPNPSNAGDTTDGNASIQRFWNGAWTSRVRALEGRNWNEADLPLTTVPSN